MVQALLYVQDYERTCDIIINKYMQMVKSLIPRIFSHCFCLREGVGLKGRDVSGSDLIPLQYAFNHLVNV